MSSSAGDGTKVTSDPASLNNPKNENPGVVTSDSLGAESIQEGGSFAANSDSRGPMAQPSKSSTAANTDVSSADRLEPAPDAQAREAGEAWKENGQLNAGNALSAPSATSAAGKDALPGSGGSGAGGEGVTESAGNAGSSVGDDVSKPKGKDITEGGFDSDAPNASFNTDIGGKDDPGRAALGQFQEDNVPVAGGAGAKQGEVSNDGQFDVLNDAEA